jgi:hypothetical protein
VLGKKQLLRLKVWLIVEEVGVEGLGEENLGCSSSRCSRRVSSLIKGNLLTLFHPLADSCLPICPLGVLVVPFLLIHLQPLPCSQISGLLRTISRTKGVILVEARIQGRFFLRRKEKRLLPLTLVWFL